jgi:hypothetical protein
MNNNTDTLDRHDESISGETGNQRLPAAQQNRQSV